MQIADRVVATFVGGGEGVDPVTRLEIDATR